MLSKSNKRTSLVLLAVDMYTHTLLSPIAMNKRNIKRLALVERYSCNLAKLWSKSELIMLSRSVYAYGRLDTDTRGVAHIFSLWKIGYGLQAEM